MSGIRRSNTLSILLIVKAAHNALIEEKRKLQECYIKEEVR